MHNIRNIQVSTNQVLEKGKKGKATKKHFKKFPVSWKIVASQCLSFYSIVSSGKSHLLSETTQFPEKSYQNTIQGNFNWE